MTAAAPSSPFGILLRRWRAQRNISQLALATEVGSTSRHLSFLETGRSRPTVQMVLRLCEALNVPLRERNRFLASAGLPSVYTEQPLEDPDLAPYRSVVQQLLTAHMPYPAFALDVQWNVLFANAATSRMFGGEIADSNLAHRFFADPEAAAAVFVNWPDVAWAAKERLRHQLAERPFDSTLRELATMAERATAGLPRPTPSPQQLVICPWFIVEGQVIRTLGMAARFDTASAVTLDELRVELFYPLDSDAEIFFRDQ